MTPSDDRSIDDALFARLAQRFPEWRDGVTCITRLPTGLTNANYRVEVGDRQYVLRHCGPENHLLGIDRRAECHNGRLAAERGLAPAVLHYLEDESVMLVEHLPGEPLTRADLQRHDRAAAVATLLRQLHAGPPFKNDFDPFRLAQQYADILTQRRWTPPAALAPRRNALAAIEAALADAAAVRVPCHNDLVADNLIDVAGRLYLIDFEYSGNNDPCFELGNFCQEQEYDEAQMAPFVAAYFGEARDEVLARVRLQMIVSDLLWSLWALLQERISQLPIDYAAYGTARCSRAAERIDSADFARWLRQAKPRV